MGSDITALEVWVRTAAVLLTEDAVNGWLVGCSVGIGLFVVFLDRDTEVEADNPALL